MFEDIFNKWSEKDIQNLCELAKAIDEYKKSCKQDREYIVKDTAGGLIEEEEIVRCKDCKFKNDYYCEIHHGKGYAWYSLPENFCSCGRRKEEK